MTSARDRMRRYRLRLRGINPDVDNARCIMCCAVLSRYSEPGSTLCAPCFRIHGTHEQYIDEQIRRSEGDQRTRFTCHRGHDLEQHGKLYNAGGGRYTRRCALCRKEREREYAKQRRARLAPA